MSTLEFSLSLARSAIVSVAVKKMGGLLDHPIGNTSGNATSGSSPGNVGNRKYHPQLGNVIDVEGDLIKSVTDVDFDEVDRTMGGVGE